MVGIDNKEYIKLTEDKVQNHLKDDQELNTSCSSAYGAMIPSRNCIDDVRKGSSYRREE